MIAVGTRVRVTSEIVRGGTATGTVIGHRGDWHRVELSGGTWTVVVPSAEVEPLEGES